MSGVGCRGGTYRAPSVEGRRTATIHTPCPRSSLDHHFFLIVPIELVKIPIISSNSLIRSRITTSESQCFIRS